MAGNPAYPAALRLLARRELSESQVRQRLARREYDADAIDEAVDRLKQERAIDDRRTADAIARTETSIKRRGRLRVIRQVERAGIAASTAKQAVDEVFEALDPDALLDASLAKRLRGRTTIEDDAEFARLYRYLLGQGFDSQQIARALKARRASRGRSVT